MLAAVRRFGGYPAGICISRAPRVLVSHHAPIVRTAGDTRLERGPETPGLSGLLQWSPIAPAIRDPLPIAKLSASPYPNGGRRVTMFGSCAGPLDRARTIHRLVCRTALLAPAPRSGAPLNPRNLHQRSPRRAVPTPPRRHLTRRPPRQTAQGSPVGAGTQSGAEFAPDRGTPSRVAE
jgi:hypothetical protein